MNGTEFSYWLKSTFDIADTKEFNEKQTKVIKAHLDLVLNNHNNERTPFCNWLEGFFDLVKPETINSENTLKIREKLETCLKNYNDYPSHMFNGTKESSDHKLRC